MSVERPDCDCIPRQSECGEIHRPWCALSLRKRSVAHGGSEARAERDDNESPLSDAASELKESGSGLNSDGDDGRNRAIDAAGDREALGRLVRHVWMEWAREQPNPKPSWLTTWGNLSEPEREVDRRIGEYMRDHTIDAALASGWVLTYEAWVAGRDKIAQHAYHEGCNEAEDRVRELEAALRDLHHHVHEVRTHGMTHHTCVRWTECPMCYLARAQDRARAALSSEREASA